MTSRSQEVRLATIMCGAAMVMLMTTLSCDSIGPEPKPVPAPQVPAAPLVPKEPTAPKEPTVRIMPGQIVYSDPWGGIFVADSNRAAFTNLSGDSRDFDPAVSADGKKIAFSSWVGNEDGRDIWVMNADGTNRLRLTHTANISTLRISTSPAWSPDGRRIAFVTSPGLWEHKIFVMNANGSDIKQITDDDMDSLDPEWSFDGDRILFSRPSGYQEDVGIFEMNQDGSNVRRVSRYSGFPTRSPDGRSIAFSAGSLFVMNSDGSNVTVVMSGFDWSGFDVYGIPDESRKVAWSPDGKSIIFAIGSASKTCYDDWFNADPCGVDLKRVGLDGVIDTTWQIRSASSPVWQR